MAVSISFYIFVITERSQYAKYYFVWSRIYTVDFHLSERWLPGMPIIWMGWAISASISLL